MERERLLKTRRAKLHPKWSGAFEGWSRRWVNANFWRVRKLFLDEEDAMQECALIFIRTLRHYDGQYENDAHLMSLFKTSVLRDWLHYSKHDQKLRLAEENADFDETDHSNMGPLAVLIAQSSKELQMVLQTLSSASTEMLQEVFLPTRMSGRDLNKALKRICGIRTSKDLVKELKAFTLES
jgi:DNA-directed RNA polymerase specialized sigma24 family protein